MNILKLENKIIVALTFVLIAILIQVYLILRQPYVQISQGILKGKYLKSRKGYDFIAFTGVPYARPPVGSLRFQAPRPAKPWMGILDATKNHPVCPQISIYSETPFIIGNENCLFLNVYTPKLPSSRISSKDLFPVLFYIHGGAFILGSGRDEWIGPDYFMDKRIVLVVINYRLGALGFLSTADKWAPGNNGLKDQSLALNWVKDNIAYFGGDPNKITVFGNSAGAACAHYQMISSLSKDIINGVIVQSGSAYAHYALSTSEYAKQRANQLGQYLDCPTTFSKDLLDCLKKFHAYEIVKQETRFSSFDNDTTIPFRIVIEPQSDNAFLTEDPLITIRSRNTSNVPLMTGMVTEEGAYKAAGIFKNEQVLEWQNKNFDEIVSLTFGITKDVDYISRSIKEFYFGKKNIDSSVKSQLTDMYTDGLFLWGLDTNVRLHFKYSNQSVYQYLFGYRGSTSYSKLFGDAVHNYGVSHTDELLYLFPLKTIFPNYKPNWRDERMIDLLTTLWSNFAATGNPTPERSYITPVRWKPVQSEKLEYYSIINHKDIKMNSNLHSKRTQFWRKLPIRIHTIKYEP